MNTRASSTRSTTSRGIAAFPQAADPEAAACSMEPSPPLLFGDPDALSEAESLQEPSSDHPPPALRDADLLARFKVMLQSELSAATSKLAAHLTREIRELGNRTNVLEDKMDAAATVIENHEQDISDLRKELDTAVLKLEDFENRSRRGNLRLRGLPESIDDLTSTATALFQELVPALPIERLEFDRIHRALGPKKPDGPPRDIIIKFTFYRTKETLLRAARDKRDLCFQGHPYQLFSDLAPSTIQKRRLMKPYTSTLLNRQIKYQWGFPFKLTFTHKGRNHTVHNPEEAKSTLELLHLLPPQVISPTQHSGANPPSNQLGRIWEKVGSRKRSLPGTPRQSGSPHSDPG